MTFCQYCFKLIPQGFMLWWNQKTYHPDCCLQVAITDQQEKEKIMNCKRCEKHIVATCQVMWRGYPFHEDCLAKAIQEANQPATAADQLREDRFENQFLEDIETGDVDYEYDNDYEPDFEGDEDNFSADESLEVESEFYRTVDEQAVSTKVATFAVPPISVGDSAAAGTAPTSANDHLGSNGKNVGTLITHCGARRISREELSTLPTPEETRTFKPISHAELIEKIVETLWYRRMNIVRDEYAVSADGMKLFGLLEMDLEYRGVRFAIGIRNSNDKSMRVAMVAGYRVTVCDNMMLQGDFQPLLAKHSPSFALEDALSIACDRIQRNIGRLHQEITDKQERMIEAGEAKSILYTAFTDGRFPIKLLKSVHREFFIAPSYEEFKSSTMWSLENALTTSLKQLNPVSQFEMTARLGKFLAAYH